MLATSSCRFGAQHRERAAIAATSALLIAANDAGWQQLELADFLGMKLGTVHKRIQAARQTHPDGVGLVVDAPLGFLRRPRRRLVTRPALAERAF